MKKLIICFIIVLLCSQNVLGAIPAKEREGKYVYELFEDVSESAWYNSYLLKLVNDGSIDGVIEGDKRYFKPESKLTKAEYITALLKPIIGVRKAAKGRPWYEEYGKEALNRKLIEYDKITELNAPITREEMAVIAVAFLRDQKETLPTDSQKYKGNIKDIQSIKEENINDLLVCYGLGIITGYPNGNFGPQNVLKRSEAISVIGRIFYKELRQPAKVVNTDIPEKQVVEGITVTRDDYVDRENGIFLSKGKSIEFAELLIDNIEFYLNEKGVICFKGYLPHLPDEASWNGSINVTDTEINGTSLGLLSEPTEFSSWIKGDECYSGDGFIKVSEVHESDLAFIFISMSIHNSDGNREGILRLEYFSNNYRQENPSIDTTNKFYYEDFYDGRKWTSISVDWDKLFRW